MDIDDVMAENVMADTQMQDQIEQAQLSYANTHANLEASQVDINRMAAQDAATATATLEADLAAAILANTQRKDNVTAQADVLTAKYRQQLSDLGTKKSTLQTNRQGILATAFLGGANDILTNTAALITTIQNQTAPVIT